MRAARTSDCLKECIADAIIVLIFEGYKQEQAELKQSIEDPYPLW